VLLTKQTEQERQYSHSNEYSLGNRLFIVKRIKNASLLRKYQRSKTLTERNPETFLILKNL